METIIISGFSGSRNGVDPSERAVNLLQGQEFYRHRLEGHIFEASISLNNSGERLLGCARESRATGIICLGAPPHVDGFRIEDIAYNEFYDPENHPNAGRSRINCQYPFDDQKVICLHGWDMEKFHRLCTEDKLPPITDSQDPGRSYWNKLMYELAIADSFGQENFRTHRSIPWICIGLPSLVSGEQITQYIKNLVLSLER